MRRIMTTQALVYGINDVAELESASKKVQSIYNKALAMLIRYLPQTVSRGLIPESSTTPQRISEHQGVFQKWIHAPKGWKCVGYEWQTDIETSMEQKSKINGKLQSMILQMVIWSQFEEIILFHPFLGQEAFYTGEELETISSYFIPTYMSDAPLIELGKLIKKRNIAIPIYQELIPLPSLVIQSGGTLLQGIWMTGVNMQHEDFQGISPYIKEQNGYKTFVEVMIN
jgi:hypothetical protein